MSGARRRKWPWVIVFGVIALLAVFYVGGAWFFSSQVYADALKAEPYDPAGLQTGSVTAVDGTGERTLLTIRPDEQYRAETKFDASRMGLVIGESLVVVGPAIRDRDGDKTRPILDVIGDEPRIGDRYGLARDVWLNPEQAGLDAEDVDLKTLDGLTFPAWQDRREEVSARRRQVGDPHPWQGCVALGDAADGPSAAQVRLHRADHHLHR